MENTKILKKTKLNQTILIPDRPFQTDLTTMVFVEFKLQGYLSGDQLERVHSLLDSFLAEGIGTVADKVKWKLVENKHRTTRFLKKIKENV